MTHTEALRALLSAVDMLTYPGEDQPQDPEPWGDWNNGNGDSCGPAMAAAIAQAREALVQPSAPSATDDIADRIINALTAPECHRLREWAAIGPVQRAAVESFAEMVQDSAPSAEPAAEVVTVRHFHEYEGSAMEDTTGYLVTSVRLLGPEPTKEGTQPLYFGTAPTAPAPAQEDREARDALAQAWAALPVWLLNHPGVQAVYRAELAALTQQPSAAPAKRTLQGQRIEELEAARAPAVQAPKLCTNCAPDGQCMKRQALCEFTGTGAPVAKEADAAGPFGSG